MPLIQLLSQLAIDTTFSWARMFIALFASILLSLAIGIWMGRSKRLEGILLPIIDIFQTLPILAFFPFALYVFVFLLPGFVGINVAVIFLIITSMLWNMIFGVYESVKTLPQEMIDVARMYKLGALDRLRKIFIPASMPRLVEQSVLSWSIGLFYLVTSEIFSTGSVTESVQHGIGAELTALAFSGNTLSYAIGILVFIAFVVATRFLFFMPWQNSVEGYSKDVVQKQRIKFNPFTKMLHIWHLRPIHLSNLREKPRKLRTEKTKDEVIIQVNKPDKRIELYYAAAIILASLLIFFILLSSNIIESEFQILLSLLFTFARVWFAFLLVLIVAVPVSIYLAFVSKRESKYLLLFQILASIPATILLPLIVVLYKSSPYQGELVALTVFFLSGIWYMIFSIIASTRAMQGEIFEVKKIFGVKGWNAWKSIYIKAIMPGVVTGAITAIAAEWNASIVAEYFTTSIISPGAVVSSVNIGLGEFLDKQLALGHIGLLLLGLANLVIVILLLDKFLWKKLYKRVEAAYR